MSRASLRFFYLTVSAVVILCDRLTKILVAHRVELNFGSHQVIPNFFSITHVENAGAAFSLFADWSPRIRVPLLIGFSTAAMIVVCYLLWSSARSFTCTGLALALILGGAIGNVYDRIRFASVVDFLEVHIINYHFPDFNLADSAIVTGACLLFLDTLLPKKKPEQPLP